MQTKKESDLIRERNSGSQMLGGDLGRQRKFVSQMLVGNVSEREFEEDASTQMSKVVVSRLSFGQISSPPFLSVQVSEKNERLDWSVPKLTDEHVKTIEFCNKFKKGEASEHYDTISQNYEGMYLRMGYPDPQKVANMVAKYQQKYAMQKENVKILDLGCGTGLVGHYLADQGFNQITGIDISSKMLKESSDKGVYSELCLKNLGNPKDFPDRFKNHFDFVTCTGLINNNHMDYLLFEEMLLSVKQDGFIVFAAQFSYMGDFWYDKVIREMQVGGRWFLIESESFFKFDQLEEVSIGRFSRTPCRVFVFQKVQGEIKIHVDKVNQKLKNFLKLSASRKLSRNFTGESF